MIDFLVLVLNTHKGYLHFIIPVEAIKASTIAFNPFSKQESQFEKYLNRWDLIEKLHNLRHQKEKFKEYLSNKQLYTDYMNELNKEES